MTCNHINPEKWSHAVGTDGQKRAFCMTCGKFMGYVKEEEKPAKLPEKRKRSNAHVS